MTVPPAHAQSLHLFEAMERSKGKPTEEAAEELQLRLEQLDLLGDLQISFTPNGQLDLKSLTDKGLSILKELKDRVSLPPCPDGEHNILCGVCSWCGRSES